MDQQETLQVEYAEVPTGSGASKKGDVPFPKRVSQEKFGKVMHCFGTILQCLGSLIFNINGNSGTFVRKEDWTKQLFVSNLVIPSYVL